MAFSEEDLDFPVLVPVASCVFAGVEFVGECLLVQG